MNNSEQVYQQRTEMDGREYYPLISVSFHTSSGLYHARSMTTNQYKEPLNPMNQILSVSTQKQFGSPAGMFTMNLVGTQWHTYLNPQDVVVIQMGYAGEATLTTVMVGLIDKVGYKRGMDGSGKPQINTSITGRDFGKLFVKDLLKFYPEISGKNASDFFLTDVGWINLMKVFTTDNVMKGTPAVILDNIMKYIFPKVHDVSWTLWNEKMDAPASQVVNVKDMVSYGFAKIDFFMPFIFTADQYEGALWNLFDRAAPKPFCEIFIDTRSDSEISTPGTDGRVVPQAIEKFKWDSFQFGTDNARIVIGLRETPFDTVQRNKLVRHQIPERDIITDDVSKSDEMHYNLFWAGTTINPLGIDLKRVSPPLLNEAAAKKYGLSPLEVNVEGMEIVDQNALEGMSGAFTKKLKAWFENNHNYHSGSLEMRGKADIRVGHVVEFGNLSSYYMEYYVEGVQHTYNVFQGWTTTLTLTRGMPVGTMIDSTGTYVYESPIPGGGTASYIVQPGDTLVSIAADVYKDFSQWWKIWQANSAMLTERDRRNVTDNGRWIYPGQVLILPA